MAIALVGVHAQAPAQNQQPSAAPDAQGTTAPSTVPPAQPTTPTIRVSTNIVHLVATVMDRHRKFITDLDESDFHIMENDHPQKIQFFGRETDLPLRIGLLLDTSNSIRPRFRFEQDAALDFLNNVIRRHKDLAFLMTFDNEPQIIQDYTDDISELTNAIERQRAGGGTALRDAVYIAADKLARAPLPEGADPEVRRVIVVISDGEDNLSDRAQSETLEEVERSEAAIYAISTSTDWLAIDTPTPQKYHKTQGDQVLEQFADQTGGRVFFPYKVDDLSESFQDIGTELRSQYFIAYTPNDAAPDGKFRKIQVEVDRKGYIVRTRKGYFASQTAQNPTPANPPGH